MKLPDCVNPFHKDNQRKEILFGAFLVLSFFIFHSYFENSFNGAFLEVGEGEKRETPIMLKLLACIEQNSVLAIGAFGLAILVLLFNVRAYWEKRIISGDYLWTLSFIAGFYLFYRSKVFDVWDFTPIYYMPCVAYTDLILFFTLSEFVTASWFWIKKYSQEPFFEKSWVGKIRRPQWFRSCIFLILQKLNEKLIKEKPLVSQNNGFVADSPLDEENNEDKFGYEDYAKNVAQRIIGTPKFKHSFAIGINGKWGSGKSSFMYLLEKELKKEIGEDIIEVKFNPWRSESSAAIIKDFFEEFQQALRPYSSRTGSLLQDYSDKLVEADKTDVLKLLKLGKELIWHGQTKESLFKEIKDVIEKIDRKIIVYIDDLDRLDNDEIVEVLKLVRNTANFPNTFFVVAYDRDYVISAIDKINSHNKEFFLEKIFQLEVSLPFIGTEKILKMLQTKLSAVFEKAEVDEIMNIGSDILNKWLESGRDIVRMVNSFLLNYKDLKGEVDVQEMFLLEILRCKYPIIYYDFRKEKNKILTYSVDRGAYVLRFDTIEGNKRELCFKNFFNNKFLNTYNDCYEDIEKIMFIIFNPSRQLFSYKNTSVAKPSMFDRYFSYAIGEDEFSAIQFSIARAAGLSSFLQFIDNAIDNNLNKDIEDCFISQMAFDSIEDYRIVVKGCLYSFYKFQKASWNSRLINKLFNLFCVSEGNPEESAIKEVLLEVINDNSTSSLTLSSLIHYIQSHGEEELKKDGFVLNKPALEDVSIMYLRRYLEDAQEWNGDILKLYSNCRQTKNVTREENGKTKEEYPKDAKDLVLDFLKEYGLEGFLKDVICIKPLPPTNNRNGKLTYDIGHNPVKLQLFKDWKEFEEFINEQDEKKFPYLKDFKPLFKRFSENGHKPFPVDPPNPA